jgi:hypothetical protein
LGIGKAVLTFFQELKEITMTNPNTQLNALIGHWLGKLSPTLFAVLAFIYYQATSSLDGKVGESIESIATATGLSRRTVQPGLKELAMFGAIQILSTGKERMLIEIPPNYWHPPPKASTPDVAPTSIPELVHRLCGQRASPQMLAIMKGAALTTSNDCSTL